MIQANRKRAKGSTVPQINAAPKVGGCRRVKEAEAFYAQGQQRVTSSVGSAVACLKILDRELLPLIHKTCAKSEHSLTPPAYPAQATIPLGARPRHQHCATGITLSSHQTWLAIPRPELEGASGAPEGCSTHHVWSSVLPPPARQQPAPAHLCIYVQCHVDVERQGGAGKVGLQAARSRGGVAGVSGGVG